MCLLWSGCGWQSDTSSLSLFFCSFSYFYWTLQTQHTEPVKLKSGFTLQISFKWCLCPPKWQNQDCVCSFTLVESFRLSKCGHCDSSSEHMLWFLWFLLLYRLFRKMLSKLGCRFKTAPLLGWESCSYVALNKHNHPLYKLFEVEPVTVQCAR